MCWTPVSTLIALTVALFATAGPLSAKFDPSPKTASGENLELTSQVSPPTQQPCRQNSVTVTITVSGIPYWLSRDPIGERGGLNLHQFILNDSNNHIDVNGEWTWGSSAIYSSVVVVGVAVVVSTIGQWKQSQQVTCDECGDSTSVKHVMYDKGGNCCISIKLVCRDVNNWAGNLGFKHCYLSIRDTNDVELGTISGFPNFEDKTGFFEDADRGTGGSVYSLTGINNNNGCDWAICAYNYARFIDGKYGYEAIQDNSNTFVKRVVSACGGSASFPWSAWGS